MATSYPRRDSPSGLWRLSDITSNIKTEGTWPAAGVRGISKFFGLPGLALSLGYEGYDQYRKYKEGEGFLYNLLNKDE